MHTCKILHAINFTKVVLKVLPQQLDSCMNKLHVHVQWIYIYYYTIRYHKLYRFGHLLLTARKQKRFKASPTSYIVFVYKLDLLYMYSVHCVIYYTVIIISKAQCCTVVDWITLLTVTSGFYCQEFNYTSSLDCFKLSHVN